MDRVILGDNQFFAVNHLSDERSRFYVYDTRPYSKHLRTYPQPF